MPTVTGVKSPLDLSASKRGPWLRTANGDLYAVGEDTTTANRLAVSRSTDGGDTWAKQGTGPDISNGLYDVGSILISNTLHIVGCSNSYVPAMGANVYDVTYHTFN